MTTMTVDVAPNPLPRRTQRAILSAGDIRWIGILTVAMPLLALAQVVLDLVSYRIFHQTVPVPLNLPAWLPDLLLVLVSALPWLGFRHQVRPLARSGQCREAWRLVRTSTGAQAVRRQVLAMGRALTLGDLQLMQNLARVERARHPRTAEIEQTACRRLHLDVRDLDPR